MISLLSAAETSPALAPGQHIVDLSQANMIAGAIVGGFGVTAVFIFIGYLLFKGGLRFHFGPPPAVSSPQVVICNDPTKCPGHGTLEAKQEANDKAVDILFEKFKGMETKMDEGFSKVQEGQQAIVLALAGKGIKVAPVK
ncbi:MAG: hypothetical protein M1438_20290 [Deltaproteobacteria bacterium]|nr:hypothetical protein [Deltaproteobacteria bacterium]